MDNRARTDEFLKLFRNPVFVNLDEQKEQPPRHTIDLQQVLSLNDSGRWGAYFSVNGFANFAANPSRKIDYVTSLNAHFVEVDAPDKSTQEIKNEASLLAAEKGIPFTCLVTTGRGVHGYWVFKEPIVNPTEEQKRTYGSTQDRLTKIFGGDTQARDIARILRIPLSKYWKDGSGKEIELGSLTENRYEQNDFTSFLLPQAPAGQQKKFTPIEEVMYAKHGERHGKSYRLALKLCNQFGSDSRSIAHAVYRAVIDQHFEKVAGDDFHNLGGEADKQFESAWNKVQSTPHTSWKEADEPEKPKGFKHALTFSELMNREFPEPQWAVENLFESGTINMISARPNHYKSWVVLEIALAAAKGDSFLGMFPTPKQSVMIVNEEDGVRMIQDRVRMLYEDADALPLYFHIQEELKLTDADVSSLLEEAAAKEIGMIIFDSLRSVHDKDENSSQEIQGIMNQLKKFARKGITVLFTHHNRKKQIGKNSDDGEESRGSSAINAAVHGHLSLAAHEDGVEKYIVVHQQKLKGAAKIKPFEISIVPLPWGFEYREHKESAREANRTNEKVLLALATEGVWLSVEDLIFLVDAGGSTIRKALKSLYFLKKVEVKDRKDITVLGLSVYSAEGAPNQKVYRILPVENDFLESDTQAD